MRAPRRSWRALLLAVLISALDRVRFGLCGEGVSPSELAMPTAGELSGMLARATACPISCARALCGD